MDYETIAIPSLACYIFTREQSGSAMGATQGEGDLALARIASPANRPRPQRGGNLILRPESQRNQTVGHVEHISFPFLPHSPQVPVIPLRRLPRYVAYLTHNLLTRLTTTPFHRFSGFHGVGWMSSTSSAGTSPYNCLCFALRSHYITCRLVFRYSWLHTVEE